MARSVPPEFQGYRFEIERYEFEKPVKELSEDFRVARIQSGYAKRREFSGTCFVLLGGAAGILGLILIFAIPQVPRLLPVVFGAVVFSGLSLFGGRAYRRAHEGHILDHTKVEPVLELLEFLEDDTRLQLLVDLRPPLSPDFEEPVEEGPRKYSQTWLKAQPREGEGLLSLQASRQVVREKRRGSTSRHRDATYFDTMQDRILLQVGPVDPDSQVTPPVMPEELRLAHQEAVDGAHVFIFETDWKPFYQAWQERKGLWREAWSSCVELLKGFEAK